MNDIDRDEIEVACRRIDRALSELHDAFVVPSDTAAAGVYERLEQRALPLLAEARRQLAQLAGIDQ